ncbi:hypothetical protein T03_12044 [Trichinella britovi]|uniref:Uncharacterized protein n=1 Tax=Trichinella britovi TaxID=45882 RepID=A0A0V1AJR3_TRIBR|nr:hypothetical protein T03_12044 [Trichinella britovi]
MFLFNIDLNESMTAMKKKIKAAKADIVLIVIS